MSIFYPDELILYGLSFNAFLPFNVKNDVLTKVRKNFFEHNKRQSDKLIQNIGEISIKYLYNLEKKKPMKWIVQKNKRTIEESIIVSVNSYEIRTYNDKGEKIISTEYSNDHRINKAVFSIDNDTVVVSNGRENNIPVLFYRSNKRNETLYLLEINESNEVLKRLSEKNPFIAVTAFTNKGLVYFGSKEEIKNVENTISEIKAEIKEETSPKVYITDSDKSSGFNFKSNDFNLKRNMNDTYDISKSEYFDGEEEEETVFENVDNSVLPYEDNENNSIVENISQTDEKIEEKSEAPCKVEQDNSVKENKSDVENESIENNAENNISENSKGEENLEEQLQKLILKKIAEAVENGELSSQIIDSENSDNKPGNRNEESSLNDNAKNVFSEFSADALSEKSDDNSDNENFSVSPDLIINSGGEKYLYYGELNDDLMRDGYGRTEMSNGRTAYEGDYSNNKRHGFGSYYYRDGGLCYTGEWKDNRRQGFGVGIRSSDGSYHTGMWKDNVPCGTAARFDKYGNLSYVSNFRNGKPYGLSVEFNNDGSITIFKWINDEKKIIETIYP